MTRRPNRTTARPSATRPSDRPRRPDLLGLLALAASLLDLAFTVRALRRRAATRRTLYRDGVLPRRTGDRTS